MSFKGLYGQSLSFDERLKKINFKIYQGDFANTQKLIDEERKQGLESPLQKALLLDAEGELLHRMLDVDAAELKWKEGYKVLQTVNADSIYYALFFARFARVANYKIEHDKAMKLASDAVALLQRHLKSIKLINAGAIYREYAYAHKMILFKEYTESDFDSAVNDIKKTIYYSELSLGKNNYYKGSAIHDWGNLWVDRCYNYRFSEKKDSLLKWCNQNGNQLYQQSIKTHQAFFKGGDRIAMSYMLMGLANNIQFLKDSLRASFQYFNQALEVLVPNFKSSSNYDNPPPQNNITDIARVLQNIHYKSAALVDLYHLTKDTSLLHLAYKQSKDEEGWYELLLRNYKSKDISLVVGGYGILPYPNLAEITFELYRIKKDKKYLNELFTYTELQHHFSLLTSTISKNDLNSKTLRTIVAKPTQIQSKLKSDEAILEFITPFSAILITHKEFIPYSIKKNEAYLLSELIAKGDFSKFKSVSYQAYKATFQPVLKQLNGVTSITIIPHSGTATMPIEALLTDTANCLSFKQCTKNFLIQKYNIHYHFSSTLWYADTIHSDNSDLTIFNPSYTKFATLPFNQALCNQLSKDYQGINFTDGNACKSNFIQSFSNSSSVFHLAAHGNAVSEFTDQSRLFFSGEGDSSFLQLESISEVKCNSPLVVLSACKTTLGRGYGGEGSMNFTRAFKVAGAKSVISTLWSVDDKATSELLKGFYKYLDEEKIKSEALRLAKLDYLANAEGENVNPLYWSGLVLYGNDNTIAIHKRHYPKLWFYCLSGILVVGGFLLAGIVYRRKHQSLK